MKRKGLIVYVKLTKSKMNKPVLIGAVVAAICFGLGIITGVFGIDNSDKSLEDPASGSQPRENVDQKLLDSIDNSSIREWLQRLTVDPHVGGTDEEEGQEGVAGMIEKHMRDSGLKVKGT